MQIGSEPEANLSLLQKKSVFNLPVNEKEEIDTFAKDVSNLKCNYFSLQIPRFMVKP